MTHKYSNSSSRPPISFEEVQEAYEDNNQPKMDWVQNSTMSVSEFNRLKLAESKEEYREIWAEIEEERDEMAEKELERQDR